MPAIETIKRGDRVSPKDPPVCCDRPMELGRGVCGLLWECFDCEDGLYVDSAGRVFAIMWGVS